MAEVLLAGRGPSPPRRRSGSQQPLFPMTDTHAKTQRPIIIFKAI